MTAKRLLGNFIGDFLKRWAATRFVFPYGIPLLVAGRLVYGNWNGAFVLYGINLLVGLTALTGIVPILGVYAHWWIATTYFIPVALSYGVTDKWPLQAALVGGTLLAASGAPALLFTLAKARRIGQRSAQPEEMFSALGIQTVEASSGATPPMKRTTFWLNALLFLAGSALTAYLYANTTAYIISAVSLMFNIVYITAGIRGKKRS